MNVKCNVVNLCLQEDPETKAMDEDERYLAFKFADF